MTNTGKIVTSLAVGVAIGATLGLLFAPYKGKKTRAFIAERSKGAVETLETTFNKAKEMVGLPENGKRKVDFVS